MTDPLQQIVAHGSSKMMIGLAKFFLSGEGVAACRWSSALAAHRESLSIHLRLGKRCQADCHKLIRGFRKQQNSKAATEDLTKKITRAMTDKSMPVVDLEFLRNAHIKLASQGIKVLTYTEGERVDKLVQDYPGQFDTSIEKVRASGRIKPRRRKIPTIPPISSAVVVLVQAQPQQNPLPAVGEPGIVDKSSVTLSENACVEVPVETPPVEDSELEEGSGEDYGIFLDA